jgi:putative hydroxymethylpyrimidine transport system substrate-binding protein
MNRHFLRFFLIAAVLVTSRPALAADTLTVLLDWFVNPNHGPLIVAREIGAFDRAGLDVEFVPPADPTMPPRLVAARHGDIAIDYQPQLYQQVVNGLPLMRIGVLLDKPLQTLMTLEGYGVTKIADLKGKRIGYNEVGGPENLAEISCMLSSAGLTMNDITLVNVGTALSTSLLTHRVDAIGVYRNFEAFELTDNGAKPIGFDYEKYGVPEFDDLIMVVNKDTVHDPRYPKFLAAVKEGAAYIAAHPDEAWKLFIHAYPDLDNKLNRDAWYFTVPYFAADPAALDTERYARVGAFLVQQKVIRAAPPLESFTAELK